MLGRRTILGAVAALGLSAWGIGCGDSGPGAKPDGSTAGPGASSKPGAGPWLVGAYFSLSGAETQFGIDTEEGHRARRRRDQRRGGGSRASPIKVLYEDDKSNPQEANNKVLQLIDRDKVVALLGEVASSLARPAASSPTRRRSR
jgi:branched-chain amino acid transport system substrate-binding protein